MKILSFDPGDTTGYVYADIDEEGVISTLDCGELQFPSRKLSSLLAIARKDFAVVVVEDFITRKSLIGSRMIAIQVIGAIRFVIDDAILQQPAEKQRCPDKILKEKDLWHTSPHVRDAYRHIVIWQQKRATRN